MSKTIHSTGQEALCQALIDERKAAGLSQADLAKKLHCHQSMIARIESGQRRIDVVELIVITRALGVQAEKILESVKACIPLSHGL